MFATYKLAQTFGITSFALDYLSKKRFYDVGDNVASAALGYTAWLTDYGRYALMAALAYIVTQRRKIRLIHIAILVMIFLVAATPLVLKSSRSAVFFLMLSCAVVHHYGRKRISFSALSAFAVAGFMILVIMGGLRSSRGTLELNFSPAGIVETVGARDGVGFSLLAKIVTDMPEAWDYQMGKTYVAWVFAPVPRSLWSEKPIISLGQEVKVELFGRAPERGGGIPPKSVGELFINFGYFSIPLLLPWFLAAGVVCKSVYRTFIRQETPGPFLVFAYAIVLIEIIPSIFVGQFSGNMVSLIKMSITLWILMFAFVLKLRIRNT